MGRVHSVLLQWSPVQTLSRPCRAVGLGAFGPGGVGFEVKEARHASRSVLPVSPCFLSFLVVSGAAATQLVKGAGWSVQCHSGPSSLSHLISHFTSSLLRFLIWFLPVHKAGRRFAFRHHFRKVRMRHASTERRLQPELPCSASSLRLPRSAA